MGQQPESSGAPSASWPRRHPWLTAVAALGLAWMLVVFVVLFTPLFDGDISSKGEALTYEQASAAAQALESTDGGADSAELNPQCATEVLDRGERTQQAALLLHGYTNCPAQFRRLAQAYFDAGYNVVSLRLPAHGHADRLTKAMTDLTPAELASRTDTAMDITAGLGEEVTVVGLSAGGTLAAWLAAQRDDVTTAVLIAPLMVPKVLPNQAVAPLARAARYLPDYYVWWDGDLKAELASPPYAYPRFSIRSMGAMLALGRKAQSTVTRDEPLDKLVIITTENDAAVSNAAVTSMGRRLEPLARETITLHFPAESGYSHDLIDPQGDNAEVINSIYAEIGPLLGIPQLAQTPDPWVSSGDAIPASAG